MMPVSILKTLRFVLFFALLLVTTSALRAQQPPTPTPAAPLLSITEDEPLTVALVSGAGPVDVRYVADVPQIVTIIARSEVLGAIDTTVQVLSPTNENLAYNDDHDTRDDDLSPRDSVIEELELPAAGTYIIRVASFTGASSGNVILTVQVESRREVRAPGDLPEPVVIEDRLRSNRTYETTFEGLAGDLVTITVRDLPDDDDIDPVVVLLNADGDVLAENDDHENRDPELDLFDARIENFELPEDGPYTIEITEYFGDPGDFELTIEFIDVRATSSGASDQPVLIEIEGSVPVNGSAEAAFEAAAGEVVTITVRAAARDELDPIVTLQASDGSVLAENDDHTSDDESLERYDSQIADFVIPETGSYIVVVSGYGTSAGDFTLTIEISG